MKTSIDSKEYLKTTDLNLCAAICSQGHGVEYIDTNNPNRAVFYIPTNKELDECRSAYFRQELRIEPIAFGQIIKQLKTRIYNS